MKITDLLPGEYCTRPHWGNYHSHSDLAIGRTMDGDLCYYYKGKFSSVVTKHSSAYDYSNFTLCNKKAQPLPKEPTMKYTEIKIIVASSNQNTTKAFESEESALDWIADQLDNAPRTKFTMFKPYQKVEPKRTILTELITKITS